MQVILAQPRGFCAGVKRAIKIVSRAIEVYGAPLYVRHEIVHNRTVVEELKAKGAIFVDDISQVPDGATLIFSAHGVPRSVSDEAHARPLRIFDATCPLVTKVHRQVVKLHNNGKKIIMIGHAGHPEVEGTMGQIDEGIYLVESVDGVNALELESTSDDLSYVTQTTISVDDAAEVISALKAKFPSITYGTNVKEVTTQVAEGSVDCGIVYCTDAFSAGLTVVDSATKDMCGQVIYPAAVMKNAKHADAAKAFLEYLQSDAAMKVFENVGFSSVA